MAKQEQKGERTALLIIDVEPKFITTVTRKAVPEIVRVIEKGGYALYVVAEYTDKKKRIDALHKEAWRAAHGRIHEDEETIPEIAALLETRKTLRVVKTTRSLFGNDGKLTAALRRRRINQVHIVGIETHDCVLATALDAFDHGFLTRVIEKACASKDTRLHEAALTILARIGVSGRRA